jgi:hypothetical protein
MVHSEPLIRSVEINKDLYKPKVINLIIIESLLKEIYEELISSEVELRSRDLIFIYIYICQVK